MISLEKAILFNTQGILLFGTPGDFTFDWKDVLQELPYPSAGYFVEMPTREL
jgi:hypothetical protein